MAGFDGVDGGFCLLGGGLLKVKPLLLAYTWLETAQSMSFFFLLYSNQERAKHVTIYEDVSYSFGCALYRELKYRCFSPSNTRLCLFVNLAYRF
jgi:hypothetical protein